MHDAAYGQSPSYIKDIVVPLSDLPGYSRPQSAAAGQHDVPFTRTQFGRRALSVAAPTEWNILPANLRSVSDITAFKKAIKTHCFRQAYSYTFKPTFKVFASVLGSYMYVKCRWSVGCYGRYIHF